MSCSLGLGDGPCQLAELIISEVTLDQLEQLLLLEADVSGEPVAEVMQLRQGRGYLAVKHDCCFSSKATRSPTRRADYDSRVAPLVRRRLGRIRTPPRVPTGRGR